jgi:isocitrate dehydrogenase
MCPDGKTIEAEAAHGTVTRHYREHQKVISAKNYNICNKFINYLTELINTINYNEKCCPKFSLK